MAKRRHKPGSAKYSLSDLANLHREGRISDREWRRAGGLCHAHEIDQEEYQRDAGPGFGKTQQFGPGDFGGRDHIDSFKGNRRQFPKESRVSAYKTDWYRSSSSREAKIQRAGNMYDEPGRNGFR
jgi:hypothetical protein